MNKKGSTPITFVFVMLTLVLVWAGFLSKLFATIGETTIANGATGVEAFFFSNLNLFFFCGLLIAVMAYGVWGGSN